LTKVGTKAILHLGISTIFDALNNFGHLVLDECSDSSLKFQNPVSNGLLQVKTTIDYNVVAFILLAAKAVVILASASLDEIGELGEGGSLRMILDGVEKGGKKAGLDYS
jgi:hypothetical protein